MLEFLLDQDPTPWYSANTGNLIGGLGGALIGILGGIVGATAGMLAPKGKARGFVLGLMGGCAVLGALTLLTGLTALILGQPYAVWYPLVMLGALPAVLFTALLPVVRKRYAEAEQRRLDADALRRS